MRPRVLTEIQDPLEETSESGKASPRTTLSPDSQGEVHLTHLPSTCYEGSIRPGAYCHPAHPFPGGVAKGRWVEALLKARAGCRAQDWQVILKAGNEESAGSAPPTEDYFTLKSTFSTDIQSDSLVWVTQSFLLSPQPSTSSVTSDEKVDYVQVDKEKTQALQNTMQEWTDVRQSSEPSKGAKL